MGGGQGAKGREAAFALSDAGGEGCALEGLSTTREKRHGGEEERGGERRGGKGRRRWLARVDLLSLFIQLYSQQTFI